MLASVDGDQVRPVLAALLVLVGLRILVRFSRPLPVRSSALDAPDAPPSFDERGITLVAATGGVTNGLVGAWGPVVTPFLLHRGLPPRYAIGSVNTAEVAVATIAAGSLLGVLGRGGLDVGVVLAMLAGGVIGAPAAAYVVRFVPPRAMGVAVAGLLLVTNVRELASWSGLGLGRWALYGLVPLLVAAAALAPRLFLRPPRARLTATRSPR